LVAVPHYSSARAIRLREAAARGPGGGRDHLRWLIRRVAADDPAAFADLFYRVAGTIANMLHRRVPDQQTVVGIIAGTFVEVWWLAGGHVDPDADVLAWINEIVQRRVADSRPPAASADSAAVAFFAMSTLRAQRSEVELIGLLRRRVTP
jgi:hypothetical protein